MPKFSWQVSKISDTVTISDGFHPADIGFSDNDRAQYKLCIEVWIRMADEIAIANPIIDYINRYGLRGTTQRLCDEADLLLSSLGDLSQVLPSLYVSNMLFHAIGQGLMPDAVRKVLQILRFSKRMTPHIPVAVSELEHEFMNNNNRVKLFDRHGLRPYLIYALADTMTFVSGRRHIKEFSYSDYLRRIPTGVTAEGYATWAEKVVHLASVGAIDNPRLARRAFSSVATHSVFQAVPKTMFKSRGIAEEPLTTQLMLTHYGDAIVELFDDADNKRLFAPYGHVVLTDQSRNQMAAYLGSLDGSIDTIDLKSASDSVSYALAHSVLDPIGLFPKGLSTEIFISSNTRPLYVFATMGTRVTFPAESLIFWAITCTAVKLYSRTTSHKSWKRKAKELIANCYVYGDDIAVPHEISSLVIDLLQACGLTVNDAKTWTTETSPYYRESCGKEYIDGIDVSSIYWPRHYLDEGAIPSLIKLQNRLYNVGCAATASWLAEYIRSIDKRVPCVLPGSDILGVYSAYYYARPATRIPAARIVACELEYHRIYKVGAFGAVGHVEHATVNTLIPLTQTDIEAPIWWALEPEFSQKQVLKTHDFDYDREIQDELLYIHFCVFGPMYSDDLSRALGVSERVSFSQLCSTTEYSIKYSTVGYLQSL